jgi:glycosyltransferase involved in cell wall biosynthesis
MLRAIEKAIDRTEPVAHVHRVLIAVCTHKRPKMLEICLASLLAQEIKPHFKFEIVVVDNDANASGHQTFIKTGAYGEVKTHYICELNRGIPFARNAAIKYALDLGFDYLAFIDDDEFADHRWIAGLMHPDYLHVPILMGQRTITFDKIPEWAKPKPEVHPSEGDEIAFAYTYSVRYSAAVLEAGIRFDESIGLGGGSDRVFSTDAKRAGFKARYTARAITWEAAHPERFTLAKLAERAYSRRITKTLHRVAKRGLVRTAIDSAIPFIASGPKAIGFFILSGAIYPFNECYAQRMILKAYLQMANALGRLDGLTRKPRIPPLYAQTVGE